jgi:hypothetical protein
LVVVVLLLLMLLVLLMLRDLLVLVALLEMLLLTASTSAITTVMIAAKTSATLAISSSRFSAATSTSSTASGFRGCTSPPSFCLVEIFVVGRCELPSLGGFQSEFFWDRLCDLCFWCIFACRNELLDTFQPIRSLFVFKQSATCLALHFQFCSCALDGVQRQRVFVWIHCCIETCNFLP